MKHWIAASLTTLLLCACGGQESDETAKKVSLYSSGVQQVHATSMTSLPGERRSYDIISTENTLTGKSKVPAVLADFYLPSLEVRLRDISLTYDKNGIGGQLYRLYQAAFGRIPDVRGFGFWKDAIENNGSTLQQVGSAFLESQESKTVYGASSDDTTFIAKLYQNVLGRKPDTEGAAFWMNALKTGTKRVDVLLSFSESAENKIATAATAQGGMPFAEPGVAYLPVSNAHGPKDVAVGVAFAVDGSASTDANDDKLSYIWSVTIKPSWSIAAFATPNMSNPKITLDIPGTYQLTLWTRDASSQSYSPAQLTVVAHSIVADSGTNTCSSLTADRATVLYSLGHTYLDRNKDGKPCDTADITYEMAPSVPVVPDTGTFKCSTISHAYAVLLYLQGHNYLDRDHDGKPCEATDLIVEKTTYTPPVTPPVVTPPVVTPPVPPTTSSGKCWVNGYTKKNGTHVSGYWRSC